MKENKRELINARRKANQDVKKQSEAPLPDNRVSFVTYTNLDGEERRRYCQDFKIAAADVNCCSIMWLGDTVENEPGKRQIIGYTFQIKEMSVEILDQTWEEYSNNE